MDKLCQSRPFLLEGLPAIVRPWQEGGIVVKKIVVTWNKTARRKKVVGMSHPCCCAQDGSCGKKHGS